MLKKLAFTFVGLVATAAIAFAAQIPLLTGPVDPSGLQGTLNQLIQSINNNVQNKLYGNAIAVNTTAVTTEETLYTYTLPAGYLAQAGDSVRAECAAQSAATATVKTLRLYFGTSVVAATGTSNNTSQFVTFTATRGATAASQSFVGNGMGGAAGIVPTAVVTTAGTDNLAADVIIKCTGQNGTANANDISGKKMMVEAVK